MNGTRYLADLLIMAALIGALSVFFLSGEEHRSARAVSLALGAILLFFAARPLAELPTAVGAWEESAPLLPAAEEPAVFEEAFCLGVRRAVAREFALSEEQIDVFAEGFSYPAMKAENIRLALSGAARAADLRGIRQYVGEHFGPCEVVIGFV